MNIDKVCFHIASGTADQWDIKQVIKLKAKNADLKAKLECAYSENTLQANHFKAKLQYVQSELSELKKKIQAESDATNRAMDGEGT